MAANIVTTMTSIDDLNADCLREILSYIDVGERVKLRRVSKKWCSTVDDCWRAVRTVKTERAESREGSNKKIEQVTGSHNVVLINTSGQKLIAGVMKRCGDVIKTLTDWRHEKNNSSLPLATKHCSNIENLITVVANKADDKNISQLLAVNKKLKRLYLQIRFNNTKVFFRKIPTEHLEQLRLCSYACDCPSSLIMIGQKQVIGRCSSLRQLSVDYFDDELVKLIGQKATLETLDLAFSHRRGVTESALYHILKLKTLRTLRLQTSLVQVPRHIRLQQSSLPITDGILVALAQNLLLLRTLHIRAPAHVTNEGFKSLASLEKLAALKITDCPGITDEFLILFSGLVGLALVNCPIRDEGVIQLLEKADTMLALDLQETLITNKTLIAAVNATKMRKNGIRLDLYTAHTSTTSKTLVGTSPLLKIIENADNH